MRIIVTGASGFIGAAVVRRAIEAGHEVVAGVRSGADLWRLPPLHAPHALVRYDLDAGVYGGTDLGSLLHRSDAVIHCAWENGRQARANPAAQLRSFSGTATLFEAAMRAGVRRFVAIGSQAEGGMTAYARAKSAARDILLLHGQKSLAWARLYSVYGPGERRGDSLLARLVRHGVSFDLADMDEMPDPAPFATESSCNHFWHYLYEDDAADALLDLATREGAPSGVVEVPGYPPQSLAQLLDHARSFFPSMPPIVFGDRREPDLRCAPPYIEPKVSFTEGVRRLVEAARGDAR